MMKKTSPHMRTDLTSGPVRRHLIVMSLPMMVGLFFTMGFNLVDTYFVAQLGTAQLAAMSFTFPVVMLILSASIGLGAGTSSVLSRAIGKGDQEEVRSLTLNALAISAVFSIFLTVLGLLTIEPLFHLLGAEDHLLPLIRQYITPYYFAIFLVIGSMVTGSAMRAAGNTTLQSRIMIWTSLFNACLDPFLIFHHWIIPGLGIEITGLGMELEGAAIATVLARAIHFFACTYYLMFHFDMLSIRKLSLTQLRASSKEIMRIAAPATGTNMVIPIAGGVLVALIAQYGEAAVAGFGVASRIEAITLIIFYALSSVIGPFVGQNLGANKTDRITSSLHAIALFCILIGLANAIFLYILSPYITPLFSDQYEIQNIAILYLAIVPISYMGHGIVMSVNATFNAIAKPLPGVIISMLRTVILQLPLAYMGGQVWGISGIFAGTAVANLISGLLAYYWGLKASRRLRPNLS